MMTMKKISSEQRWKNNFTVMWIPFSIWQRKKKKKQTNNTMMKRERYLIVFQKKKIFSYKKNMFSIVVEINVSRIENNKQKNFITCLTNQKNWKKKTTEQQNRPRCTNDSFIHKFVCSCIANLHFSLSWQTNKWKK